MVNLRTGGYDFIHSALSWREELCKCMHTPSNLVLFETMIQLSVVLRHQAKLWACFISDGLVRSQFPGQQLKKMSVLDVWCDSSMKKLGAALSTCSWEMTCEECWHSHS